MLTWILAVLVGLFAWTAGRRWEIADRRRLQYVEVASCIATALNTGTPEARLQLFRECAKTWIDGGKPVVVAMEKALDALQVDPTTADRALRELVIAMRSDVRLLWKQK